MKDFDAVVVSQRDKEFLETRLQTQDKLLCYFGIPVYVEESLPAGISLALLHGRVVGIIKDIGKVKE